MRIRRFPLAGVGLSPATHGTTVDGLTALAAFFPGANKFLGSLCQACVDQETGSAFINGPGAHDKSFPYPA